MVAPSGREPKERFDERIVACYLHPITRHGYPPPAEHTVRYVEELHALGFRSVELEGIHESHLRSVAAMRDDVRRALDDLEVRVPVFCVVLPGLASPEQQAREHALTLFALGCRTARDLGASSVLDNGPLPPYAFAGDLPVVRHYDDAVIARAGMPVALEWPAYWRGLVETFQRACDIAAAHELTYLLHPAIGVLCATTDGFLHFREAVDHPALRFALDTANQFVQHDPLALALVRLAPYLGYIHLSDNRGSRPEHVPPGEGAIDWDVFFDTLHAIGYQGRIGVDVGGSESDVGDLDRAYVDTARFVARHLP